MGTVSIRIEDELLAEINRQAKELHVSRGEYVRRAIADLNEKMVRDLKRRRLQEASLKVRKESMRVNREFAAIEDDPDA